jgi:predicted phosphodiesterase
MSDPIKTYVVINDLQIPFQDHQVVDGLVLPFIKEIKPDGVVMNGDIVDCYAISDFDKDPERISDNGLSVEIEQSGKLMKVLEGIDEKWWIGGNHEDRMRRVAWRFPHLRGMLKSFPEAFHIKDYGFKWKEYGDRVMLGKLIVTHGEFVSADSAMSARRHFARYGNSIMHGHTHRLGVFYKTNVRGMHGAWENGCLCDMHPEYVHNPDWQHGFSVVHVYADGYFDVQQIPIIDRHLFHYGKERFEIGRRDRLRRSR